MKIDSYFACQLNTVSDVPEPLRSTLMNNIHSQESVRLLIYTPTVSAIDESSPATVPPMASDILIPATVLGVTNDGWIVVSEAEEGGASVERSNFSDTLFLELTSILLYGQLRIDFASVGTSYSAIIRFNTVAEEFYRGAIDLMLDGTDKRHTPAAENDRADDSILQAWPEQFRAEARRYRPKGQRLLAATQWPAIIGGFRRELSPAGALLVTERELVLITEERTSPRFHSGDLQKFGGIITYFPLVRLADFHLGRHERFGVLALQAHAVHGGERLEIIFPADHEKVISQAMEQVRAGIVA
ncbi:MAG: hypothetical protein WB586_30545 [Chthoniobacterales bacterium]